MAVWHRRSIANDLAAVVGLLGVGAALLWGLSAAMAETLLAPVATPVRTIALLALATWLLHRTGERWTDVGLRRPDHWLRASGVVLGGYLAIALAGTALITLVFPALGWSGAGTGTYAALRGDAGLLAYWLLIAWTCAALGEELLFRGFLLTRLERIFGGGRVALIAALMVQATIFGLSHAYQGASGIVLTGVTGLVLGCAYLASRRNLVVVIVLHGLVDTVSLTAIHLGLL